MANVRKSGGGWTTKDELTFLARIRLDKPLAYARYVKSIDMRKDWAGIDPQAVRTFVRDNPPVGAR